MWLQLHLDFEVEKHQYVPDRLQMYIVRNVSV